LLGEKYIDLNTFSDTIQKVNYNGGGRVVVRRNIPNPVGVVTFKDDIFWVDRNLGGVYQAPKYQNTSKPKSIRTNLPVLRDIQVFDINAQPEPQSNPCKDSICEQLCFALPSADNDLDYVCDCSSGMRRGTKCVDLVGCIFIILMRNLLESLYDDFQTGEGEEMMT